jgi:hypothetical protein
MTGRGFNPLNRFGRGGGNMKNGQRQSNGNRQKRDTTYHIYWGFSLLVFVLVWQIVSLLP